MYHQQLDDRLIRLPADLARGISPERIAGAITESVRQSGLPATANALTALSQQLTQATGQFQRAAGQLRDCTGIAERAQGAIGRMTTSVANATDTAQWALQTLEHQVRLECVRAVCLLCGAAWWSGCSVASCSSAGGAAGSKSCRRRPRCRRRAPSPRRRRSYVEEARTGGRSEIGHAHRTSAVEAALRELEASAAARVRMEGANEIHATGLSIRTILPHDSDLSSGLVKGSPCGFLCLAAFTGGLWSVAGLGPITSGMQSYLFQLDDLASKTFQGIVVIFMTEVQEVSRRRTTDKGAGQIPYSVMGNEADQLRAELAALKEGTPVESGPGVLWQIFGDSAVSANHRVCLPNAPVSRLGIRLQKRL
jgi:hypothetical protein